MEGRPEAENLINIFAGLSGHSIEQVMADYGGQSFSAFKNALSELAVATLSPLAAEMRRLTATRRRSTTSCVPGPKRRVPSRAPSWPK
jgi:tryptophanyl-tRNA synthetase